MTDNERTEIINYGIYRGKIICLSIGVVILMGILMDIFWQSIVFMVSFSLTRRYAGGFHARSQKNCYIISFIALILALTYIKQDFLNENFGMYSQVINFLLIVLLAPVENENRKLDDEERRRYGKRTKITAVIFLLLYNILFFTLHYTFAKSVGSAMVLVGVSLIIGYIKNAINEEKIKTYEHERDII